MLFSWLRSLGSNPWIIELSSTRIRILDVARAGALAYECEPLVGMDSSEQIVSIGRPIAPEAVRTHEPFTSIDTLQREMIVAERILMYALIAAQNSVKPSQLPPAPRVIVRLDDDSSNRIRGVDDATLTKLLKRAGAFSTIVRRGSLSLSEARTLLRIA